MSLIFSLLPESLSSSSILIRFNSYNNLSNLYKHLYGLSNGEYIYFLEDDDYLSPNFGKHINYNIQTNSDLYYMNYRRVNASLQELLSNEFKIEQVNIHFQLSQLLFKKKLISLKEFPDNNDLDNDWKLFQLLKSKTTNINIINQRMFIQTTDGNDNISFPHLNKDIRWNLHNNMD